MPVWPETRAMTDIFAIINTPLIDPATDTFWNNNINISYPTLPKKVLIITEAYTPNSAEEQQLLKILGACKLAEDSYHIVHIPADTNVAWHQLKNTAQPEVVISFGLHPQRLGISALFRLNSGNRFDNTTWIPTLSLTELEQQPQAKKDLWGNALKPLFADNQ